MHFRDRDVQDLLEGALTPEANARIQEHMDECASCRELVAEALRAARVATPGRPPEPTRPSPRPDAPVRVVIRDGRISRRTEGAGESARAPTSPTRRADAVLDLSPGTLVADRYRLEHRVGEGGGGVVWAATHTLMKRRVALKFLSGFGTEATRRFLREARVCAALRHPHVVAVHDTFVVPGTDTPVMVMDLLQGESLGAHLRREGALPAASAARILVPVAQALAAAHARGIVHRDLKPENVFLVGEAGRIDNVLVLDFGLAKLTATDGDLASTSRLTRSGVVMGTPHYLAPEQVAAEGEVDHRADLWALGVVLYQCLSGKRPFQARGLPALFRDIATARPAPVPPTVPAPLAALLARMLRREPAERASLGEVEAALRGYLPRE